MKSSTAATVESVAVAVARLVDEAPQLSPDQVALLRAAGLPIVSATDAVAELAS